MNRLHEFIEFTIDTVDDLDRDLTKYRLCEFCKHHPNCDEQDHCDEGIYKYLMEEDK